VVVTVFIYRDDDRDHYDIPAYKLDFKARVPCMDLHDRSYSVIFERVAAHMLGRCTVVYVEQGTTRDERLWRRITRALREKYCGPRRLR
jgi:hypothetical protein